MIWLHDHDTAVSDAATVLEEQGRWLTPARAVGQDMDRVTLTASLIN